jgi:hypothetical protein
MFAPTLSIQTLKDLVMAGQSVEREAAWQELYRRSQTSVALSYWLTAYIMYR